MIDFWLFWKVFLTQTIAEFTQLQEKKALTETASAERVSTIEMLKEKLRVENDTLKTIRAQLKDLLTKQQNEKQSSVVNLLAGL